MIRLKGRPVSPGYAEGTAVVYDLERQEVPRRHIEPEQVAAELQRLDEALERSQHELELVRRHVLAELGRSQAAIFSAHQGLLRDQHFLQRVRQRIEQEHVGAEQAVDETTAELADRLAGLDDPYIRERAQDIRDVGRRLLRQLARGHGGLYLKLPPGAVVVATELLPSETFDLDREHLAAIVTELGGENSHAAILARSLAVPAVTGVANATAVIHPAMRVLVDGQHGEVIASPTKASRGKFNDLKQTYQRAFSLAAAAETQQCVTRDGTTIGLYANLGRPEEAEQIGLHRLDGVGLFRTEYLFLEALAAPPLETHYEVYHQLLSAIPDKPVVIRTLDLGGDKIPQFLTPHYEANPNLGLRGLRFALAERHLLETQVRAMLRAGDSADLRILFPMVLGANDLGRAISEVEAAMALEAVQRRPPLGAMIETPAALFALEEILELVDFVSIGTNDLTQFMLAADRNAVDLLDDYSVLHPSVLRAVAKVVETAADKRRQLSVCGEAAGDPQIACLLVGLGVRELSMSPARSAKVRYALRHITLADAEQIAQRALSADYPQTVRRLLSCFRLSETLP